MPRRRNAVALLLAGSARTMERAPVASSGVLRVEQVESESARGEVGAGQA